MYLSLESLGMRVLCITVRLHSTIQTAETSCHIDVFYSMSAYHHIQNKKILCK